MLRHHHIQQRLGRTVSSQNQLCKPLTELGCLSYMQNLYYNDEDIFGAGPWSKPNDG